MSAPPGGRSLQMFCMLIFNFNADVKKRKKLAGPTCWVQSSKFGHCTDGLPDGSVIRKYARPCGQSARHSAELGKARQSIPHSAGVNPINFDVIIFYYYYYYFVYSGGRVCPELIQSGAKEAEPMTMFFIEI